MSAIMALDGGRTIVKVSDLTPERTAQLLGVAGLEVDESERVVLS